MIFESRPANQKSSLQAGKDQMNPSQKIGFMESMNLVRQLSGFSWRLGGRRQRPLAAGGDGAHIPCCWSRWHNAGVGSRAPL